MKKPTTTAKRATTAARIKKPPSTKVVPSSNAMVVAGEPDPQISRAKQALAVIRERQKLEKIEKWRAAGNTVNDPVQVSRITGIAIDLDWTQEYMAYLLKINPYIQSLVKLRERADKNEAKYLSPGRIEMNKIMAEIYGEYLKIENGGEAGLVYQQLKRFAGKTHEDTPNASLLVKVIFPNFSSKRVHVQSRVFEYAKQVNIQSSDYIDFLKREGGSEKVRAKAVKMDAAAKKITDQSDLQTEAEIENERDARTNLMLEFQRTEPFLTVTLTTQQYSRVVPKPSVAKPGKNYDMVVLLAEIETDPKKLYEFNVYGTVPLTNELRKNIIKTLGDHFVRDGAFADRYRAWLDARETAAAAAAMQPAPAIVATKIKPKSKSKAKPN